MQIRTVYASRYCSLDSDVRTGGGTDVTEQIQSLLDIAKEEGGVHLIMDGAALVRHLRVYDNTTIECLSKDCGFYQKDHSDNSILTNAVGSKTHLAARNITVRGGTFNQNCANQVHHRAMGPTDPEWESNMGVKAVFAMEFYGVENLTVEDCTICDFRTYAFMLACFRNCRIENVWLDLPGRMQANNQDGFHFWGPGQFLTIRSVGGRVGDDFMNIGPDEEDGTSPITDVLVDGVFLDDADQAIRILSRGTGTVDRVTIRNMSGTYRSFGFFINSWFPGDTCGQFGDLFFENIDLRQVKPNYDYRPPMLFNVGGEVRSLICKNVRSVDPFDNRTLFELGLPFYSTTPATIDEYKFTGIYPHIDYFEIDGLTVLEKNEDAKDTSLVSVYGLVDTMVLRNVNAIKKDQTGRNSCLVNLYKRAEIRTMLLKDVYLEGYETCVKNPEKVGFSTKDGVIER